MAVPRRTVDCDSPVHQFLAGSINVFNPVGQVVGQINQIESCRDIVFRLLTEYSDALEHVNAITPAE